MYIVDIVESLELIIILGFIFPAEFDCVLSSE